MLCQFEAVKQFIGKGGNVLVMMSEGGESALKTNINFFLEEFGIMVNPGRLILLCHILIYINTLSLQFILYLEEYVST